MLDHLSPLDASYLYLEDSSTAMNAGTVLLLETPPAGIDVDEIVRLVAARIEEVPRYRCRVRHMPLGLSAPVWVEDTEFDLAYHVRRVTLPAPGGLAQLEEFCARTLNRPLDRRHPLWELYIVDGVVGTESTDGVVGTESTGGVVGTDGTGGVVGAGPAEGVVGAESPESVASAGAEAAPQVGLTAIVTKTHQALVDGRQSLDIAHLLLDAEPRDPPEPEEYVPGPEPSDLGLLIAGGREYLASPGSLVQRVAGGVKDAVAGVASVGKDVAGMVVGVARTTSGLAPATPLNAKVGGSRRVSFQRTDLEVYRRIRDRARHTVSAGVTVNDVVLAVIAGAMRAWWLSRGEPMHSRSRVRAMVPLSAYKGNQPEASGLVEQVITPVVDLPIGEPDVVTRLRRISFEMRRQVGPGRALGAESLADLAGFAPPTLHHLGVRMAEAVSSRLFNFVVTNVPGPQHELYVGHARMIGTYPVTPLIAGQGLAVGVTSYDGGVYFGLNGDSAVMADIDRLARFIPEALAELHLEVSA